MSAPLPKGFLRVIRRILPADSILIGTEGAEFGTDKWFAAGAPDVVVFPKTTEEVSKLLRAATRAGVPLTARGAGYGYVGGCVPVRGGMLLSTSRMDAIEEIHAGDFVAVVRPGVITGKLQAAARRKGLFYPPDPASLHDCSIGGNIATNAGGPRCLKYGVTRNYVLGLEVVLMDGTIARVGGRTHKNKTGFDLVGIFTGSEGLLGVVTQATLKLLPHPPERAAVSAGFASIQGAARAVQAVLKAGFLPSALEVADQFTLEAARNYQGGMSIPPGNAHFLLELDGQPTSVRSEIKTIRKILESGSAKGIQTAVGDEAVEKIWDIRRTFSFALRATGLRKLNEDVVVPRSRLVDLVRFASRLQKSSGFPIACFGHAGDGNIHVNVMVGDWESQTIRTAAENVLDQLFHQVIEWGGAITGEHGVGLAKLRWWEQAVPAGARELHRRIKETLDPAGLCNPGKFLP